MKNRPHFAFNLIAAALLFGAVFIHPTKEVDLVYVYYIVLHLVVFAVGALGVHLFSMSKHRFVKWVYLVIAVVYNPVLPILPYPAYLDREVWKMMAIIAGAIFIAGVVLPVDRDEFKLAKH